MLIQMDIVFVIPVERGYIGNLSITDIISAGEYWLHGTIFLIVGHNVPDAILTGKAEKTCLLSNWRQSMVTVSFRSFTG
jgi:hypothetical protein